MLLLEYKYWLYGMNPIIDAQHNNTFPWEINDAEFVAV